MNHTRTRAVLVGGLSLVRSFAGLGIPTVVISRSPRDMGRYSRYCNDWRTTFADSDWDESRFLQTLIDIANEGPDMPVLYYGDDPILWFITKHREELRACYRFTMPDADLLDACTNKVRFAALACKHGLPVPKTLTSGITLNSRQVEKHIGFPCVVKPGIHTGWYQSEIIRPFLNGSQKVLVVNNAEECERALDAMGRYCGDFIVQEYVRGNEDNIYSFHAYIPQNGGTVPWYIGKKIRTFPAVAGESAYVELIDQPQVAALGFQVVEKLGLRGPIKIDLKKDAGTGEFLVLEINLRFNLWNHLGTRCGINLPWAAYQDNTGLPLSIPTHYRHGLGWINFGLDLRSFVKDYYPSRQLSMASWLASLCRPKVCSIFSWRDPLPFVMYSLGYLKRLPQKLLREPS